MRQGLSTVHVSNCGAEVLVPSQHLSVTFSQHFFFFFQPAFLYLLPCGQIWSSVQTAVGYWVLIITIIITVNYYQYPILQMNKPKPRFPNPAGMPLLSSLWFGGFWAGIQKNEFPRNESKWAVQKTIRNPNISKLSFEGTCWFLF